MARDNETGLTRWQNASSMDDAKQSPSDKLSPYDEDIDKFFGGINELTDKFSDMTKKFVGHTFEHHPIRSWWQSRDQDVGEDNMIDTYFNRPYQTRDAISDAISDTLTTGLGLFRSPFDLFNLFTGSSGVTPYGLFAYQGPSPKEYNTCMKKEGVSLWDSDGYWRCLFPNSNVPAQFLEYKKKQLAGQIVTKDDFEERANAAPASQDGAIDLGEQGVFFRQFGDFLNWKNKSYENERKLAEQQREEFQQSLQYTYGNGNGLREQGDGERKVIGTSLNSSTTTESGEVVTKELKTEYFSDGTSVTNSVIKRKPQGADVWASVEEKSESGDGKPGWFWNSK
ncbi:hypothetical protein METSCH_C07200 [Metschnikowia aff. pulcherrima]|uniref:Mitochondrial peculiar membrane protein 1 n=1 Tax=Metschnikowia aff. pulcherrima TaxID=2163413 RepID=A0A4P6XN53_9ASCO|nr:hypothetical protein METSCH_C07200 [Metschnikowia aff. pulcherrima]